MFFYLLGGQSWFPIVYVVYTMMTMLGAQAKTIVNSRSGANMHLKTKRRIGRIQTETRGNAELQAWHSKPWIEEDGAILIETRGVTSCFANSPS